MDDCRTGGSALAGPGVQGGMIGARLRRAATTLYHAKPVLESARHLKCGPAPGLVESPGEWWTAQAEDERMCASARAVSVSPQFGGPWYQH